ncbi:MAG: hypothetical protein CMK00_07255 [Planctomycetes bacterium]|jgi:hypothetical protein|nr:hypothetical protein [Planctomycetota bacterium]
MDPVIIKRERIRLETPKVPCSKSARLLEESGRAVAVELKCSCGELTVVRLDQIKTSDQTPALPQATAATACDNHEHKEANS